VTRWLWVVLVAGVGLYLPTIRYDFVQDDRPIIVANPAAHSPRAALQAFDQPYWPRPAEAGLYRPVTILSFAVDWSLSGGRPGWFHLVNALCHGLVGVLVALVLARWLPPAGAVVAGLVFIAHPVHVEGVANIVSRNELLSSAAMLGAILAARRRWWIAAICLALLAMLSKERGVITAVAILIDDWLRPSSEKSYPALFHIAMGLTTVGFFLVWLRIGHQWPVDVAAPFLGAGPGQRLATALPAIARAATLLVWPVSLSTDYSPQVIPYRSGLSPAAIVGAVVALGILAVGVLGQRRPRAVSFGALLAALAYLPTSNVFFASGIVLSERDLYLSVLLPAALVGTGITWAVERWPRQRVLLAAAVLLVVLAGRSLARLPAWADSRAFLLTLLSEHPESYRGQQSAAAVFAGMGREADARAAYERADSLFDRDPHLKAGFALFLFEHGDTARAAALAHTARQLLAREPVALRVQYQLALARGDSSGAAALADTLHRWFPPATTRP
jgi:hypothetical protein